MRIKTIRLNSFVVVLLIGLTTSCALNSTQYSLDFNSQQKQSRQSAKIHTELAGAYYYRGNHKVAIEEAKIALAANPEYALAYNVLGLIYMALGQDTLAQENFKQAIGIASQNPQINNNYGWFLCQRKPKQINQALGHLMVASNDPLYLTPEKSYTNMGICELSRDNYAAAIKHFKSALSLHKTHSPALTGLIEVDYRQGNLVVAQAKLARYMTQLPPTPKSLSLSIQIARDSGDHHAEDSYRFQLLKKFPGSKEAKQVLALRSHENDDE